MEIMYADNSCNFIKKNHFIAIYSDKSLLIKKGLKIKKIIYEEDWTVKKFLLNDDRSKKDDIIEIFLNFNIKESILNLKMCELSNGFLKLMLLIYLLLNKKEVLILDYFDIGLSFKHKKRIVNYLKSNYDGNLIAISNDIVFLNQLCNSLIICKDEEIIFNDEFNKLYKSKLKIELPEIIKFIKEANRNNYKLLYTVDRKELLKDIYRSVK